MDQEIELMIDDCLNRVQKLTEWEREFMQSIRAWYEEHGELTPMQTEKLESIWDRVTG